VFTKALWDRILSHFNPVPTIGSSAAFRSELAFTIRGCKPHAQPRLWRTTHHRLSVTASFNTFASTHHIGRPSLLSAPEMMTRNQTFTEDRFMKLDMLIKCHTCNSMEQRQ